MAQQLVHMLEIQVFGDTQTQPVGARIVPRDTDIRIAETQMLCEKFLLSQTWLKDMERYNHMVFVWDDDPNLDERFRSNGRHGRLFTFPKSEPLPAEINWIDLAGFCDLFITTLKVIE
jgi:hypothetical protein